MAARPPASAFMAKAYRVTFTPFKPPTSGGTRASRSAKVKNFRCAACSTVDTTVLRRGPSGPKTLCNRCGLRYRKQQEDAQAVKQRMSIATLCESRSAPTPPVTQPSSVPLQLSQSLSPSPTLSPPQALVWAIERPCGVASAPPPAPSQKPVPNS